MKKTCCISTLLRKLYLIRIGNMKELDNFFKPPFTVKTTDRFHKEVFNVDGDHVMNLEGDSNGYLCFFVKHNEDIQDFIHEVDKTE